MISAAPGCAETPRAHITNMAALECLRDIGLDRQCIEAAAAGHSIVAVSGYRSREQQARTHRRWIERHLANARGGSSPEEAAKIVSEYSAPAGHSEHQLGTTVDVSVPGVMPFNREHAPSSFSTSCARRCPRGRNV